MAKRLSYYLIACIIWGFSFQAKAEITLPAVFSDNMVLQQLANVKFWGKSTPNKKIMLMCSWTKQSFQCTANANGDWSMFVATPKAGGPYDVTISDGDKIKLSNVLIGEVWFCSGQSNMEMPMRGFKNQPVLNSNEILTDANNFNLRLFETKKNAAKTPQNNITGKWDVSSGESASKFSAVAYMYGSMLQKKLNVPVGIIVSSVGGTRIQSWMDYQTLMAMPDSNSYKNDFNKIDTAKDKHKCATALYNAMIAPFVGYGIKGFLWYQGESNRHEPEVYEQLFPAMVKNWRNSWTADSLPFYYVQIAPYGNKDKTRSVRGVREAQLNCLTKIPNSGMAVTMDIGSESAIHPPDKVTVSKRLLYWALANDYHFKGLYYSGPLYKSMSVQNDSINIVFNYAENGLTTFGKEFSNLEIAGEDKVFYPANGKIEDNKTLTVWSETVTKPVAVRYAYKDFEIGELYNTAGLPASSFRTDNWSSK